MRENNLILLKKDRKKPKEGDLFVLEPSEGLYCFGKVIISNVESKDSFINGMYLIYIYDIFSEEKQVPQELDPDKLMFAPVVVNTQLWLKGFAETITNIAVTEKEKNLEYGFWHVGKEIYVDIHGDRLGYIPKISGIFGLGSYGIIGKEIHKAMERRKVFPHQ